MSSYPNRNVTPCTFGDVTLRWQRNGAPNSVLSQHNNQSRCGVESSHTLYFGNGKLFNNYFQFPLLVSDKYICIHKTRDFKKTWEFYILYVRYGFFKYLGENVYKTFMHLVSTTTVDTSSFGFIKLNEIGKMPVF